MIVLAIDTATDAPGVALRSEEGTSARSIEWRGAFRSTVPAGRALLERAGLDLADVDAVAVPSGPGSFTGLRVGAAIAQGVARTGRAGLHAVPTFVALAEARAPGGAERVVVAIDARRGRWYAAALERDASGTWHCAEEPRDVPPGEARGLARSSSFLGPDTVSGDDPLVARTIADLVARDPDRYRVDDARSLRLTYVRPGARRA